MARRFAGLICLALLLCGSPPQAQGQGAGTPADRVALPAVIPLFPLPDTSLFPDVSRPFLIFEPRYRAMVADALQGDRVIGMVQLRPGFEADYEGRPPVYAVGCAGRITEVEELPDGRYRIMLRGLVKFRITSEDQSRAYRLAQVETLSEVTADADRPALRVRREQLVDLLLSRVAPGTVPPPADMADESVVNALAQYLDMEPAARQELLEVNGPLLRAEALLALLERR